MTIHQELNFDNVVAEVHETQAARYEQKLRELSRKPETPEIAKRIETLSRYRDLDLILDTAVALGMPDERGDGRDMKNILSKARQYLDQHNLSKAAPT